MADIAVSGPLFDGRAREALVSYADNLRDKLAQDVLDRINVRLDEVLKRDRDIYSSRIHIDRQVKDRVITDTPVVYGPWLEGVGSRNSPVTRFRGYHTFRKVTQTFAGQAGDIANAELQPYLKEMN